MTTNLNRSHSKTRDRHSSEPTRNTRRPFADSESDSHSADDIRESVKEAVGKGVAAVAGVVEGVSETLEESHLAETAESAIHQVGQMGNKVVRAAKEETTNFKHALKGEADEPKDEDDAQIERDDPTFGFGAISYGSGENQKSSTYSPSEDDDESQGI